MSEPANKDIYRKILDNLYDGVYFVDPERRITYWNKGAERISGFNADQVMGKCCSDNILVHVDDLGNDLCKGECPLAKTLKDGQIREADVYLHHANGHRIPVKIRVAPILENDKITGATEVFSDNTEFTRFRSRLESLESAAYVDSLTRLSSRPYAASKFETALYELKQNGQSFGVLFVDVDNLKTVNDVYGHDVGDKVLQSAAGTILKNIRTNDLAGRWGGDEYIIGFQGVSKDKLLEIANKLLVLINQSYVLLEDKRIQVTVSIGATMATREDTVDTLVRRVDRVMYNCKRQGSNLVAFG